MQRNYVLCALALCYLAAGCGGGSGGSTVNGIGTGSIVFQIAWPNGQEDAAARRLIPLNTQSLRIAIIDPATSASLTNALLVVRTADPIQNVSVEGIRPGAARIMVDAFATLDGSGTVLASGSANATIVGGQRTNVDVTLFPFSPPPPLQ